MGWKSYWYNYVRNDPVNKTDPSGKGVGCDATGKYCQDDGYGDIIVNAPRPGVTVTNGGGFGNAAGYLGFNNRTWSAAPNLLSTIPRYQMTGMTVSPPQGGLSARRMICNAGDLGARAGDVLTDVGGYAALGGGIAGATIGADAMGVGAVPGAIAGAAPGLATMGVGDTLSAFGNLTKDLSGGNYIEGAARFGVNFVAGKALSRVGGGHGIGSFLSPETRGFINDIYSKAAESLVGHAFSADSPVDCNGVR